MSAFTAVVLAAGEGQRLRPLTRNRPKPMLPAATRPILERVFDELIAAGIRELVVVVGYGRERVQSHFGPTYRNVPIRYVGQETQLGTGHAVLTAEAAVDGPLLVVNGDQVVDRRIVRDVVAAHERGQSVATLGVLARRDVGDYGGVVLEDGAVTDLVERPRDDREYRLNAGVYAFEPAIFDAIRHTEARAGERSLIDAISRLVSDGRTVRGVETEGLWVDATYPWDLLTVAGELVDADVVDATDGEAVSPSATIHESACLRDPVIVGDGCEIGPGAVIGPYACLGETTTVEANAVVTRSVLDTDTRVRPNATVVDCVAGQGVEIGAGSTIPGGPGDVRVGDRIFEDEALGAVLADRARDDGGVTYVPGTVVGAEAVVRAGATVSDTVAANTEVRS